MNLSKIYERSLSRGPSNGGLTPSSISLSIEEPQTAIDMHRAFGMDISDRVINRRAQMTMEVAQPDLDVNLTALLSEPCFINDSDTGS